MNLKKAVDHEARKGTRRNALARSRFTPRPAGERAPGRILLIPLYALPLPAWAGIDAGASIATVFLALALILGGFVALAWFARRYVPGMAAQGAVKVVGSTPVGTRERVVIVEVADTWLLLGVGGGNVRVLHSLPKPAAPGAEAT